MLKHETFQAHALRAYAVSSSGPVPHEGVSTTEKKGRWSGK
jgi:hypothetical protein